MVEAEGSQELLRCLDGIGFLYLQDAVDSFSRWGDAILADCVAQEVESRLAENALVPVNLSAKTQKVCLRCLACSLWLRDATSMSSK